MKTEKRNDYVTRDTILKLLTDDEVAGVSTAETTARLSDGEEYLDLENLEQGVRLAGDVKTPMGRVLPRKSVHEKTWSKILTQLPISKVANGRPNA